MSPDENVEKALEIIGEAVSTDPSEFEDHETWKFLGLGDLAASAAAADLKNAVDVDVTPEHFTTYPTVGAFKIFLRGGDSEAQKTSNGTATTTQPHHPPPDIGPPDPWQNMPKPKVPLTVTLQGSPTTCSKLLFLFPDGSGAGTSYSTLPPISHSVCVIALNSPFLRQAQDFTCSVERMARLWLSEVKRLQPKGMNYVLGGWSAGGYYAYEVAKLLVAEGEVVERMILIDSPCRLEFEALPTQVVGELTRKGLMGSSGAKKAPEWLVQHFTSTVVSVEKYMPTPVSPSQVPKFVDFIWVREGLVEDVAQSGLEVDLSVKVTRFLLEPRGELKTEGWEKLLPGATYGVEYMTGNHFQITQAPHSDDLGRLIKKIVV
ncbi:hypothetical protein LTR37_017617 [Vermiconidia calcicola]|uniref:Uncharacterized protein n=1 Tax=Vermiconidia calcicola TaxID=1690605 RepID=A0ACC3MJ91_9PEZI|nr:hypothetical protein LTR37_017617 [Vermiconidia calcicola]